LKSKIVTIIDIPFFKKDNKRNIPLYNPLELLFPPSREITSGIPHLCPS